ncbi:MAG: type II toxin-antitoxin system Phd/YefM family antitoxin [Tolypothrix carrinoi HA7290-LM1]|jgi:prevent-host-death family protein|nr:type II toxin-antitoxin system Phd/YefM family antitoxin [Tolypothrix carrinoi HA7290-LM1]
MPDQYSIAQARDRFAQIVHQAENGKPVEITRRGQSVAVVLSLSEYQRLIRENSKFGAELATFRQKYQISRLNINPDEIFDNVRDRTSGREVNF